VFQTFHQTIILIYDSFISMNKIIQYVLYSNLSHMLLFDNRELNKYLIQIINT